MEKHLNDFSPETENQEIQIFREITYLIKILLSGYGVPLQVQNFATAIFLFSGGRKVQISDEQVAQFALLSSPNYISKVRKRYLEYTKITNDYDQKNYEFLYITEHNYNRKLKKNLPTIYEFDKRFINSINELHRLAKQHYKYETNWVKAIEKVVKEHSSILKEYGFFSHERKRRRERNPQQIFATMLLHHNRHLQKMFDFAVNIGFEKDEVAEVIQVNTMMKVESCKDEFIRTFSDSDKPPDLTFEQFFSNAVEICDVKENKGAGNAVKFKKWYGEKKNVLRDTQESVANNSNGKNIFTAGQIRASFKLENRESLPNSNGFQLETIMDSGEKRYLENRKNEIRNFQRIKRS